jgi:hypothetical protein
MTRVLRAETVVSVPLFAASPRWLPDLPDTLRAVRAFRRLLLVIGVAGIIGALARLRGKGGVPPTSGGWRELEGPDFR